MKVFGIVGWKNSGKTTLVERLVSELTGRGLRISTVKHAHHRFDTDQPGKDSYRHRAAGAEQVLLASSQRWVLMTELRGAEEPSLEDLLQQLSPVDLVLVEGYKSSSHQKIEAYRGAAGQTPIAKANDGTIRAMATDLPLADIALPQFDLDDIRAIADFILRETGLA